MPSEREPGGNYASEPGRSSTGGENDDRRSSNQPRCARFNPCSKLYLSYVLPSMQSRIPPRFQPLLRLRSGFGGPPSREIISLHSCSVGSAKETRLAFL